MKKTRGDKKMDDHLKKLAVELQASAIDHSMELKERVLGVSQRGPIDD